MSTSLFVELVQIIRRTTAGVRNTPGTNLKDSLGQIIYTPPEGEAVLFAKLRNLEQFLHADDGIDPLIKMAVVHYQFEAIHPFTDGNGRTGRILNVLFLVYRGLLTLPVLYLSHYILRNKSAYYRGLREVTEAGEWQNWILFMLRGVEETSQETYALIEVLLERMNTASSLFRTKYPGSYSKDLMEVVFSNPYCRIRFLEEQLNVSRQTASTYLQRLVQLGVLREVSVGRDLYFVNDSMLPNLNLQVK